MNATRDHVSGRAEARVKLCTSRGRRAAAGGAGAADRHARSGSTRVRRVTRRSREFAAPALGRGMALAWITGPHLRTPADPRHGLGAIVRSTMTACPRAGRRAGAVRIDRPAGRVGRAVDVTCPGASRAEREAEHRPSHHPHRPPPARALARFPYRAGGAVLEQDALLAETLANRIRFAE